MLIPGQLCAGAKRQRTICFAQPLANEAGFAIYCKTGGQLLLECRRRCQCCFSGVEPPVQVILVVARYSEYYIAKAVINAVMLQS